MAARLTVVLSQSSTRDSHMTDLEESLVAALMMQPGIDATMIGPIERVQADDTDYLCVSSFNYSFAILSWLSAAELQQHWQRLGLSGSIVDPRLSGSSAPAEGRRIYHLQLTSHLGIEQALDALSRILTDRNVRTVSIGMPSAPADSATSSPATPLPQTLDAPVEVVNSRHKDDAHQLEVNGGSRSQPATHPPVLQPRAGADADPDDEPEWEHLEKLVDDFDSLDL